MQAREHAGPAALDQGGRTGQRAGFGFQDLEVVIEGEDVEELPDRPLMPGNSGGTVEDLNGAGTEPDREPPSGEPGRDRVGALTHRHPAGVVVVDEEPRPRRPAYGLRRPITARCPADRY